MPPRHVRLLAKHLSPIPGHSFYQVSTTVRLGPSRQCRFRCTANKIYPPAFRRAYNSRHPFRGNPSGLPVGRGKGRWRGWWHRGVLLGDVPPSHGGTKARCALPGPASAMARRCLGIGGRPGAAEIRRGGHAVRQMKVLRRSGTADRGRPPGRRDADGHRKPIGRAVRRPHTRLAMSGPPTARCSIFF